MTSMLLKAQNRTLSDSITLGRQVDSIEKRKQRALISSLRRRNSGARSIQPKFQPVRPGKEDHLKRWTRFFETFPVGPNRSIEVWTEISGKFG